MAEDPKIVKQGETASLPIAARPGDVLPEYRDGVKTAADRLRRGASPEDVFSRFVAWGALTPQEQNFLGQVVAPVICDRVRQLNEAYRKGEGESVISGLEVDRSSKTITISIDHMKSLQVRWGDFKGPVIDETISHRVLSLPTGYMPQMVASGRQEVLRWIAGTLVYPYSVSKDQYFDPRPTFPTGEKLRPVQKTAIEELLERKRRGDSGAYLINPLVASTATMLRDVVGDEVQTIAALGTEKPQRKLILVVAHSMIRAEQLAAEFRATPDFELARYQLRTVSGQSDADQLDRMGTEAAASETPMVVVMSAAGLNRRMTSAESEGHAGFTRFARNLAMVVVDESRAIAGEKHLTHVEKLITESQVPAAEQERDPMAKAARKQPFLLMATSIPFHRRVPERLLALTGVQAVSPYVPGGITRRDLTAELLVEDVIRIRQGAVDAGESPPVQIFYLDKGEEFLHEGTLFQEVTLEDPERGIVQRKQVLDPRCYEPILRKLVLPLAQREELLVVGVGSREEAEGLTLLAKQLGASRAIDWKGKSVEALISGPRTQYAANPEFTGPEADRVIHALYAGQVGVVFVVAIADRLHFPAARVWLDLRHSISPQRLLGCVDAVSSPTVGKSKGWVVCVAPQRASDCVALMKHQTELAKLAKPRGIEEVGGEDDAGGPEQMLQKHTKTALRQVAQRARIRENPFFSPEGRCEHDFAVRALIEEFLAERSYVVPTFEELGTTKERHAYAAIEWGLTANFEVPASYFRGMVARSLEAIVNYARQNPDVKSTTIEEMEKLLAARRAYEADEGTVSVAAPGRRAPTAVERLVAEVDAKVNHIGRPLSPSDISEADLLGRALAALQGGTISVADFHPWTVEILGLDPATDLVFRLERRLREQGGFSRVEGEKSVVTLPPELLEELSLALRSGDPRFQRASDELSSELASAFPDLMKAHRRALSRAIVENSRHSDFRAALSLAERFARSGEPICLRADGSPVGIEQDWASRLAGYLGIPRQRLLASGPYRLLQRLSPAAQVSIREGIVRPAALRGDILPETWKVLQPYIDPDGTVELTTAYGD